MKSTIQPTRLFSPDPARIREIAELDSEIQRIESGDLPGRIRTAFFRAFRYFNTDADRAYGQRPIAKWDGGEDAAGRKFKPIWDRIAEHLRQHQIDDVERYVLSQFCARTNKLLRPTHLYSKTSVDHYRRFCEHADTALRERLRADVEHFKQAMALRSDSQDARRSWSDILEDPCVDISPATRYIIAATSGLRELARRFRASALLQVSLDPAGYLRVWRPIVGDALSDLVGDDCYVG